MAPLVLGILPVVLSFVVLGAHFLRSASIVPVAACVILIAIALVPRRWAARTVQVALVLATLEWIRTLVAVIGQRLDFGAPYLRTAIILGAVAAWTLASAFVFRMRAMRVRYRLDTSEDTQ